MSYCRWSSDDFKCDLYVYENVAGCWTIHVAGKRVVGEVPPFRLPADPQDLEGMERAMADYRAQMDYLKTAEHAPIGLPHDGETFHLESPGECADKCEELAALGYNVPSWVVPELRTEHAELAAGSA